MIRERTHQGTQPSSDSANSGLVLKRLFPIKRFMRNEFINNSRKNGWKE